MFKKAGNKLVSVLKRLSPQNGEGILGTLTSFLSLGIITREIVGVPKLGDYVIFFYFLLGVGIFIILDSTSGQKALLGILGE